MDDNEKGLGEICSFCKKTQREVDKMIKSEHGAVICNECLWMSLGKMIAPKTVALTTFIKIKSE